VNQKPLHLGYYVVALGVMLQFAGLAGDAWLHAEDGAILTLSTPGRALLVIGMCVTVAGVILGLLSLVPPAGVEVTRTARRLAPFVPPVLVAATAIGSLVFAYQMGGFERDAAGDQAFVRADTEPVPTVAVPTTCPEGTFWYPDMGHCMEPEAAVPTAGPDGSPVCPAGSYWHEVMGHCMVGSVTPESPSATPRISTDCPSGYFWQEATGRCVAITPTCEAGTFWHPDMGHCMPVTVTPTPECPPDYQWNPVREECRFVLPTVEDCPPGTLWFEETQQCMPYVPPEDDGSCPAGYERRPEMPQHCMEITATPTPTVTPTPTITPTPTETETPTVTPSDTPAG